MPRFSLPYCHEGATLSDSNPQVTAAPPRQWTRCTAVVLASLGIVVCAILLRMTAGGSQDGFAASVCSPGASVNCDYVLASRWAKLGPLPTAAVGLAYFAMVATWHAIIGIPSGTGRRWHTVPVILTLSGLLASCYYVYVMATRLPVWCTWCLGAHAINLLLFIVTIRAWPGAAAPQHVPPWPSHARAIATLTGSVAMLMILLLAVVAFQMQVGARRLQLSLMEATNNADYIAWRWAQEPLVSVPVEPDDHILGHPDAPHTLVVFSDFECEKCAWFDRYARHLSGQFPDSLRIVFKHCPISPRCNPSIKKQFHYFACDAALAALAARQVGTPAQAAEYYELLYKRAQSLVSRPYGGIATSIGIDPAALERAMAEESTARRLGRDVELATSLGVSGTPTLFLDGRKLFTWHILSEDVKPRIDVTRTDELWKRLLTPAEGKPAAAR